MGLFGRSTKGYENFRNKVYTDSEGYPTIGYGHKLTQQEILKKIYRNGINKKKADALYKQDMGEIRDRFYGRHPQYKTYPKNVRTALMDASYNMGPNFLDKFKNMKAALDRKDYPQAATELLNSNYAKQVGERANTNAMRIASEYRIPSPQSKVGRRTSATDGNITYLPPEKKQVILRDVTPPLEKITSGLGGGKILGTTTRVLGR